MNKKRLIIGLVGEKLAGKGTIAEYLSLHYQAKVYRMSGILDDILLRLHLPIERKTQIDLVLALREKFGEDILAQVLKKDIEADPAPLIVIDGIRMPQEVEIFKKLPGFLLIGVTAPRKLRFERMKSRQEKLDEQTMDFQEFCRIEKESPTEISIKSLGRKAKVKIANLSTFKELYQKTEREIITPYYQR